MKKIVYIDMDNVIVDFQSGIDKLDQPIKDIFEGKYDEVSHIFSMMEPMEGAVEAIKELSKKYDLYVLSTSPWNNDTALQDKFDWIKRYFGYFDYNVFYKKVIFSHHKNLLIGDYLIDDRTNNGASEFKGEHIHFGTEKFQNWNTVLDYLLKMSD